MGLAMLAILLLYAGQYVDLYWSSGYYLVRSQRTLQEFDDGQAFDVSVVQFFLYKRDSQDALIPADADKEDVFYNNE